MNIIYGFRVDLAVRAHRRAMMSFEREAERLESSEGVPTAASERSGLLGAAWLRLALVLAPKLD